MTEHTPWEQDIKINKIVFIGKSLKIQEISEMASIANKVPFVIEPTGASESTPSPPYGRLVLFALAAAYFRWPEEISAVVMNPVFLLVVLVVIMLMFRKPSKPIKSE